LAENDSERVDGTVGSHETWDCSLKMRMIKRIMVFVGDKAKRALVSSWGRRWSTMG
jgi:hypothetical protein